MSDNKEYAKRDIRGQGKFYTKHVSAMTGEKLHSKSDIAAELAHRDIEITRLREDVERHKRLIETLSERIANDTSTLERHQAVTKALAEWSQKYPKSRIMSAPTHAKCEYELAEIELMAIALQDQQT